MGRTIARARAKNDLAVTEMIVTVWKFMGETPLIAMKRALKERAIEDPRMCYTCRLDPMAQGVFTVLTGEDIHLAPVYNKMSKVYRFEAILGLATDSYDGLGYVTDACFCSDGQAQSFVDAMRSLSGHKVAQQYPACSGYKYRGKPLWRHKKEGTLPYPLPSHDIEIYSVSTSLPEVISLKEYRKELFEDMADMEPDVWNSFNTNNIVRAWNTMPDRPLIRVVVEAYVSSGTYVRSLVHDTAQSIGIHAHAFRITRLSCHDPTKIGSSY